MTIRSLPAGPGCWAGYRVRVEVVGSDPPAAIGFVDEWPGFILIGTSVLDVLDRLDAAMAVWATYEASAGRQVPPPHRPLIPPARRPIVAVAGDESPAGPDEPKHPPADHVDPDLER